MPGNYEALEAARISRGGNSPFGQHAPRPTPAKPKAFIRTDFAVGKFYKKTERFVVLHVGMTRDTAEAMAGRMRGGMTDTEVAISKAEGWSYEYRAVRGNIGRPRTAFVPSKVCNVGCGSGPALTPALLLASADRPGVEVSAAGSNPGRVAKFVKENAKAWSALANAARSAALSPKRRSEIARKAGAARGWKCICGKPATQRVHWGYGRFHRRCDGCAK